jgi:hypothetical protein
MSDRHKHGAPANGQQNTGGVDSGQATGASTQTGRQPHPGSQPDAHGAAGGSGQDGGDSSEGIAAADRMERAADRTGQSERDRQRDIGAQTPGDPGDLLSQPLGDGNYRKQGDAQVPLPVTSGDRDQA